MYLQQLRQHIANSDFLRGVFFPVLRKFNWEIRWKHDITGRPLSLLLWQHRGYWFFGASREEEELGRFKELINQGDNVFEIGGHIGYLTQCFEDLVGSTGSVVVFEPTPASRKFLEKNVLASTKVLPIAASEKNGQQTFFVESFGGFTNSLVEDFTTAQNQRLKTQQHHKSAEIASIEVSVKTIDTIVDELGTCPDFIKIDVEGAELSVLKGAQKTLSHVRALMVEVSRNREEVFELLSSHGFNAKDRFGAPIQEARLLYHNVFFVK